MRNGSLIMTLLTCCLLIQSCGGGGSPSDTGNNNIISGLDSRPVNNTCLAGDRPSQNITYTTQRVFSNLTFNQPVAMLQAPGDSSRWFVVEQAGRVQVFANNPGQQTFQTFIDISTQVTDGGERGLLGMAFHPGFASNRQVFLSYTTSVNNQLVSRLSRFTSNDGGLTLDPASEQILLSVDQPFNNHNGGYIAFGPMDGFLYLGLGDGGSGGDPQGHGQNTSTLLGSMLRIDVDQGTPYSIPPGNPFVGNPSGRDEIYAWGLRNPWRWSFDTATGNLWLADVGQNQWEEVDLIINNGNYGWNIREGMHCYNDPQEQCDTTGLIDPVAEYNHANGGSSITGGYVYRGSTLTSLQGSYIYGEFTSGNIWYLPNTGSPSPTPVLLENTSLNISSFGQSNDGEVYVVNYGGSLHQIVEQSNNGGNPVAQLLSETGCVDPTDPSQPATAMIPYTINAPFWSDGATKQRWFALPDNTRITVDNNDDWLFPIGSVLMKHFLINNQLIETRLLMHHNDGEWSGYSYEWNDQQTDATLVSGGKTRNLGSQNWIYPSSSDCMRCHTQVAGRSLGPETAQLNSNFVYPETGTDANQIVTLAFIDVLNIAVPDDPNALAKISDPAGSANITDRARAWLHSNCAQCHQPNGPSPANIDLRYSTDISQTATCDQAPDNGSLGLNNTSIISPGIPGSSVLLERIQRRDATAMPPLGSLELDTEGITLISDWISGMGTNCQ